MEHKNSFIYFMILGLFMTFSSSVHAQDFEPTTTWPYLFKEFESGTIYDNSGSATEKPVNIHLAEGRLHFLEGEQIKEAFTGDISTVKIGNSVFINAGGRMMKVLASSENGAVAEDTAIDIQALNSTGGAYGSSSNSMATTALTSVDGIGGTYNTNHMELKNNRDNGKILPLIKKKFLVYGDKVVYAVRKDVEETDGIDRQSFRTFCKERKIKWNNSESLLSVLDYICTGK